MTIRIKNYPYGGVAAVWNEGHNWIVFQSEKQARMSMIMRFGNCNFVDDRREEDDGESE